MWILYAELFIENYTVDELIIYRLNAEFPRMNAINLSVIAAYGIIYNLILFRDRRLVRLLMILLFLFLFIASKSRTGLLIIGLFFVFWMVNSAIPLTNKIILIGVLSLSTLYLNKQVLEIMRIADRQEVLTLGGRLSSNVNQTAAWPETLSFVERNMIVGVGNINLTRFVKNKRFAVDNFFLQVLIASGLLGSIAYIGFIIHYSLKWLKLSLLGKSTRDRRHRIYLLSGLCFIIAFSRALTTNDLAFHGFGFLLLLLSIAYYSNRKHIHNEFR
ncbi:MAG: O-antigen ligase family protein [Saprospiraceae bacterium]|nr:O-antigen ligase family protein [Saprospiraceae bacterium]